MIVTRKRPLGSQRSVYGQIHAFHHVAEGNRRARRNDEVEPGRLPSHVGPLHQGCARKRARTLEGHGSRRIGGHCKDGRCVVRTRPRNRSRQLVRSVVFELEHRIPRSIDRNNGIGLLAKIGSLRGIVGLFTLGRKGVGGHRIARLRQHGTAVGLGASPRTAFAVRLACLRRHIGAVA